jgi:hypothetical protein
MTVGDVALSAKRFALGSGRGPRQQELLPVVESGPLRGPVGSFVLRIDTFARTAWSWASRKSFATIDSFTVSISRMPAMALVDGLVHVGRVR